MIEPDITAIRLNEPLRPDARNPSPAWQPATPITFSSDWQGHNPDPALETEVRVLWSPETLYLRFVCHYKEIFVFDDSDPRRNHLWERDVVEAFLQPPDSLVKRTNAPTSRYRAFYKEFEVAPNGMWLDLDISPRGLAGLQSGLSRSVHIDERQRTWTAELAIPMPALTTNFDRENGWRANFFRVEGKLEPRRYLAWQPTGTLQPDFHVPEKFGFLRFSD